jgi:hypothetical protein
MTFIPSHNRAKDGSFSPNDYPLPQYLLLQFVTAYAQTQAIISIAIFLTIIIPSGKNYSEHSFYDLGVGVAVPVSTMPD